MRTSRSEFVSLRARRHHVRVWGEAGAPTFFFLHGWGDVGASFQFAVDALQGNWRIIAPDWRGFGQSQWNEGPYVFADYIADLDALLTHYSPVQPVQIAGHSLGGIVASLYAGIRPERVSRFANLEGFGLWVLSLIHILTMGARQSIGLYLAPLNSSTGLGIASISLAMAVGQFTWGAVQPLAGAVADRFGPRRVLQGGLLLLALGSAITPFMSSTWGLVFSLGLISAMGSGAGSFSVLIGAASTRLPLEARGTASGIINAGGSFGQFVFAPVLQKLIQALGWMGSMWALALMTLAALPLIRTVSRPVDPVHQPVGTAEIGLRRSVQEALADRSYLLLHAGFFTCGFHIAFLVTHLPGEVDLCGLPPSVASWSLAIIGLANIFGSLFAGACVSRYRSKYVLFWMYASRAILIALFLAAPRTDLTFYLLSLIHI